MITISMTQKQALEPMSAEAQISDRIGSRSAQVANGLIGPFRNVDGFEFAGTKHRNWKLKDTPVTCWRCCPSRISATSNGLRCVS
jgi:hypothetical protein